MPLDTVIREAQVIVTDANKAIVVTNDYARTIEIGAQGPQGIAGPTGPTGPQGPAGGGNWAYVHDQGAASATWTVTHNLTGFPSVTVIDTAGTVVVGDVVYDSNNQVTVSFSAPFSGKAYLS